MYLDILVFELVVFGRVQNQVLVEIEYNFLY